MDTELLQEPLQAADRFTKEATETRLRVLKAIADPTRLAIVDRLAACGDRCHGDLETDLGIPANKMSFHLKVLREAGLVETERRGKRVAYTLAARALQDLHNALPTSNVGCELICTPIEELDAAGC